MRLGTIGSGMASCAPLPPETPAATCLVGEGHVAERDERLAAEDASEVLAGRRSGDLGHGLRRARGDDPTAAEAARRSEVDDPVGRLDHVEVVLDHEHRVALLDEPVEDLEQLLDVGEVETGRRLVEQVERPAGRPPAELGRELDPLGLAARQRRGRLAEMDVAETDLGQDLELRGHVRDRGEDLERLLDRHLEDVGDRAALVVDLERLAVVALALAHLARDVDVGEELHLDLEDPVALAVLAPPALDVEAEATGLVAADPRLGHAREELADRPEQAGVGRRVRARRPADRALVDLDDLVDRVDAVDAIVRTGLVARAVELAGELAVEDLGHERALARAGHPGHRDEPPEREAHVDVLEVVGPRAADDERLGRCPSGAWPGSGPSARRAGRRR